MPQASPAQTAPVMIPAESQMKPKMMVLWMRSLRTAASGRRPVRADDRKRKRAQFKRFRRVVGDRAAPGVGDVARNLIKADEPFQNENRRASA